MKLPIIKILIHFQMLEKFLKSQHTIKSKNQWYVFDFKL